MSNDLIVLSVPKATEELVFQVDKFLNLKIEEQSQEMFRKLVAKARYKLAEAEAVKFEKKEKEKAVNQVKSYTRCYSSSKAKGVVNK